MDAAPAPAGSDDAPGLRLHAIRGLRPAVAPDRVGALLCPPYDVIDADRRARLLQADPDNAVGVVLPDPTPAGYAAAAAELTDLVRRGVYAVDADPAIYVYEMRTPDGSATRGLLGAVELRDPADGVILPHENTMAGPVADRLDVMTATGTDLEPIYLVYDGGGPASDAVRDVDSAPPAAEAVTPDGVVHRLWRLDDPTVWSRIAADLEPRHALIADGHHRYATYRERQRREAGAQGPGPWDRGLTLLVDSSEYGPQVHAIHRVIPGLHLADATAALDGVARLDTVDTVDGDSGDLSSALAAAGGRDGFCAVLTDGTTAYLLADDRGRIADAAAREGELPALSALDVTVMHRGLVERVWSLTDDVDTVRYAHSIDEAVALARESGGTAVLLRPTPVTAVAAVAAAGGRMPRKSTLFTPKPASGLVMRRLADEPA
ncbi:DUF1015 domain-containing protein [Jatrophihabitans endophyticus]|uniref:DUF1015 domain-containing protein n=1 Tax=Jatrophihabitans endophyticus TaxID=1206085 RepID=UPI001A0F6A59|nr:DUF1015 domain-containing protein [Jatrophihabitans endophyticus]MBE7189654.1 DUF1015 domain-containing protein [Jatrophihabitans endophyticus]